MIVYKELSSLTNDLGVSAKALYSASNHTSAHYYQTKIPKGNSEYRELAVPDNFMKSIQKRIVERLLVYEEISPYATAYRFGGSTIINAKPHLRNTTVLKLDIRHFFDHIIYPLVKEKVFPEKRYSESNRILLSLICLYKDSLPQGAPTSPIISNIIMKDFDNKVGNWCKAKNIIYTRYCDDLTFSGELKPNEVIGFVRKELQKMGFYLNDKKTFVARNGQKKMVTGIVINDRMNTPVLYRKKLRQEIYYCKKFGIPHHLTYINVSEDEESYLRKLLGKVNYVLSIDKSNKEMRDCKEWILDQLKTNSNN